MNLASADRPSRATRGRGARRTSAVMLGLALALAVAGTAVAATPPPQVQSVTVPGVVNEVIVDPAAGPAVGGGSSSVDGTTVERFVEVNGALLDIPSGLAASVSDGEHVSVTLAVPAGADVNSALATVDQAGAPSVDVTDVVRAPAGSAAGSTSADTLAAVSPLGVHTLTVLPIYWTTPDSATQASLTTVATETAQFWSEESAGQITTTTTIDDWAQVTDPGTCDVTALYNLALAAHHQAAPTSIRDHIVVYFPHRADCGEWAGLGSVVGSNVWVNGYPWTDVVAHEIGHNLGLGHANRASCTEAGVAVSISSTCTITAYYDGADVMGYATGQVPGSLNTALATGLGLVSSVDATPTDVVTADLAPIGHASQLRAVHIPMPDGNDLYVDFRPAVGRDTRISSWAGVQVHVRVPQTPAATSVLLDMQPAGTQTYSDPVSMLPGTSYSIPGTTYVLRVLSVGASAARVRVFSTAMASPFTDVPTTQAFFPEILWLSQTGITHGNSDGIYSPSAPVTREAMAAFLYRYAKVTGYSPPTTAQFTDVPTSQPFYTEISWLAQTGITNGNADGSFGASSPVTREAMAAFLYRYAHPVGA